MLTPTVPPPGWAVGARSLALQDGWEEALILKTSCRLPLGTAWSRGRSAEGGEGLGATSLPGIQRSWRGVRSRPLHPALLQALTRTPPAAKPSLTLRWAAGAPQAEADTAHPASLHPTPLRAVARARGPKWGGQAQGRETWGCEDRPPARPQRLRTCCLALEKTE